MWVKREHSCSRSRQRQRQTVIQWIRQPDRQSGRQTDRQTDRHAYRQDTPDAAGRADPQLIWSHLSLSLSLSRGPSQKAGREALDNLILHYLVYGLLSGHEARHRRVTEQRTDHMPPASVRNTSDPGRVRGWITIVISNYEQRNLASSLRGNKTRRNKIVHFSAGDVLKFCLRGINPEI